MKKSFVLTIILVIVVAVFAALIFGTNLGSNEDNPQTLKQISFSPKTTTNTISVVDNQMLYQSIEIDSSTFSILDLATGKTIDIGTIANYIMDSGSSVVMGQQASQHGRERNRNRSQVEGALSPRNSPIPWRHWPHTAFLDGRERCGTDPRVGRSCPKPRDGE